MTIVRLLRQFETRGSRTVDRVLSSSIAVADANILSLLRGRVVGDNLTLADAATATYVPGGGGGGGGMPTPENSGTTIVYDSRSGGANSTQSAANIAAWKSAVAGGHQLYDAEYGVTSQAVATGVVGSGVKSRQVNYTANPEEHGAPLGWDGDSGETHVPAGTPWYTSGKFWIPANVTLGQGNPHWKAYIWNRVSNASGRLYLLLHSNNYMAIKIDETNFTRAFSTPGLGSNSPFTLRDRVVQWTAYFDPSTLTVRMWIKATGVTGGEAECTLTPGEQNDGTGAGTTGLGGFQDSVTLYTDAGSGYAIHTWDHVIWY